MGSGVFTDNQNLKRYANRKGYILDRIYFDSRDNICISCADVHRDSFLFRQLAFHTDFLRYRPGRRHHDGTRAIYRAHLLFRFALTAGRIVFLRLKRTL